MTTDSFQAGFLLFPDITQLDLTGPYEVLASLPGPKPVLIAATRDPVRADNGLTILPTATYDDCPPLDLICVPGGPGMNALLTDAAALGFLRRVAPTARFVTSVCTGALVLGAAGLLTGKRAATHWMSREMLRAFGAEPVDARVVVDGNVITGGGVTAGIDFGLAVVAEIAGRETAEAIQLRIEYDPQPPFTAGSPRTADPALVERVRARGAARQEARAAQVARAAAALAARA